MSGNQIPNREPLGSSLQRGLLMVLLLLFTTLICFAQGEKTLERVVIGDACYILHSVQKNETLYSIARLYDCSQEEVLAVNKTITGVIKKGMVLKIPDHTYQKPKATKTEDGKFVQHQIVSGDNFYQIKLKYGIEEAELLKYNPELKEGLKAGMTLRIPVKLKTEVLTVEPSAAKEAQIPKETTANQQSNKELSAPIKAKESGETINVGLFLPISASVADSLKPTARSLSFLSFYQGAMMAVDQLAKSGLKVKLYAYDTEKSASHVGMLIRKPEFLSFDLLIGPVYPDGQKVVSELSAKNRIPMVSPLSTEDLYTKTNPSFFQVNPARKLRIETTGDYLVKEYSNERLIFLENSSSTETRQIREYFDKKRIAGGTSKTTVLTYNLWAKGSEELETQLHAETPNILVMADLNEVNVSIAMNRLALLSKKYPIILVGLQEFTRMQSIELENMHNVNMRYLTTFFVNYKLPTVAAFVENFKTEFGTEPSLFAFQGYDITTFFLNSMRKKDPSAHVFQNGGNAGLLHTSYHFTKISDFGGYTNDNFTVVEYSDTYEIRSLGTIQHRLSE